jgi:valyl-tRNA synthetase
METEEKLSKPYNPSETEGRIYKKWQDSGYFNPDNLPERHKKPYTIIMPPPNANGSLHAGHAVFVAIEDLLIRYHRMKGDKTLWLPGADHAGFETQVVYEKKLEKEGRSRFGMDPDLLRQEIMDFTLSNKSFMEGQMRQLGASCDWSREKFTLDPDVIKTVYATFQQLYDDGLVYRGKRSVNWCTKHQTSLSELETISTEQIDPLYYIKYGPFVVATVRPETIFGDVAIAVNPTDERYKKFIGQEIEVDHPENKIKLKIIADDFVDKEFGTGAVKVTPAHDPNDFAMSQRHNLPAPLAIDQFGKLTELCGKYKGLNINDARKQVVADLQALGLMDHIDEKYVHAIKRCYKCEKVLEPRILPQWFVKIKPLAEPVIQAIEKGEITFYPEHYKKIMLHWLNNIEDWNVSRQIVWGITIPAWYKDDEVKVSVESPGEGWTKETDTFDTWFSSGQWPFASLGYPDSKDFNEFYPTDVMETAGEIIFFWVARMLMFGMYRTRKLPFHTVYLHGLVTARDGKKMSKSKGNVISPLELTEKYGTDALRMGLIIGNTPGTSTALYEDKIKGYKHFANKIWNASRFVLSNISDLDLKKDIRPNESDQKTLEELRIVAKEITIDIEEYRFYMAAEKAYHYFWHTFADKILEESKIRLNQTDNRESIQYTLLEILKTNLRLLHPFMPFITEELWGIIPRDESETNLLIIEKWPHS